LFHGARAKNVTYSTLLFVHPYRLRQNSRFPIFEAAFMRTFFPLVLLLFSAATAAESLSEQLQYCATIEQSSERLSCYDALSKTLDRQAEQDFGREHQRIAEEAPDSITAAISSIEGGAYGKSVVTLDNGQIWRQTDSSHVSWKAGESVLLERGVFGSFFMKQAGGGRGIRVKRVK
jgi:hypothetical protein